jgi:hypothetical protein
VSEPINLLAESAIPLQPALEHLPEAPALA